MARRSRTKSPGGAETSLTSDEYRKHGVDGILANLGKRMEWLDIQISALAQEVLKAVKTVGVVQDFARSTEARVTALESHGSEPQKHLAQVHGLRGTPSSPPIAQATDSKLASTNQAVAVDNQDVLRGLESRLKDSFNELHRWQSAVEGVVQQAVTEGCKDQTADLQLKYEDGSLRAGSNLAKINASEQQATAKSTEATLAQLEDDIAKLRIELKVGSHRDVPNSGSERHSKELGVEQFWLRPRALKPEPFVRNEMPKVSAAIETDVDAWKASLWKGSSLSRRENGEISRLYDELLRLEEEEKAFRRPPVSVVGDGQTQPRRRAFSSSNLMSRKNRSR